MQIAVGNYYDSPEVNYESAPLFSWKDFYSFRNHVLRVLRGFGSAGPMGECNNLTADMEDEPDFDSKIVDDPEFFVVDDMYNCHDRISIVECDGAGKITAGLLNALIQMLQGFAGWYVSFALGDSGILVFSDKVLKGGRRFWDCTAIEEIAERCAKPVDFGPAEPMQQEMYPLWLAAITGGIDFETHFPSSATRQWEEVEDTLRRIRARRWGKPLTSFDYDAVRNDLHPATKRELITRCLTEVDSMPTEKLKEAQHNIRRDTAEALGGTALEDAAIVDLAGRALEMAERKLETRDAYGWWADILHYQQGEPLDGLKDILGAAMRAGLASSKPVVQFAAVFGLAKLRVADFSNLLEGILAQRPAWRSNAARMAWFEKLKKGSTSYPNSEALNGI